MFTDSHCHINSADFDADREETVLRARAAGVDYIVDVCDDIADTPRAVEFCRNHKHIYTTAGVHPEVADKYPDLKAEKILKLTENPYVIGIGECGLDYFYDGATAEEQKKIFAVHIEAAQQSGLPLIIHSREADDDMIKLLQSAYAEKPFKGELHCFSSSERLCKAALEIGFYISASGIITFKSAEDLRRIFAAVPEDRLLAETDSPYLAPVPCRGKRNEPAYVAHTVRFLSELRNTDARKMADITTRNFLSLFEKAGKI